MTAVAIDGPAGAGKTTVARRLATVLGWLYLDTGAMYRAVALATLESGVDPNDAVGVGALAASLDMKVEGSDLFLNGRNVADLLRQPEVTAASSVVSVHPEVRAVMVAQQRKAADAGKVVMEGRDIGTVVLPDAPVKIFLTASLDERARRRAEELNLHRSSDATRLQHALEARDKADTERTISPLEPAPDAVLIDTTGRSIDDVVDEIVQRVRATLPEGEDPTS